MAIYGTNILITFDMLVDIDLGLFHLIRDKYYDPRVFNDKLKLNDNYLKGLLQCNLEKNPLYIIMDDSPEQVESFYNQFIEAEGDWLVINSPTTTMVNVVKTFIDSEAGIKINIVCKTQLQYDRIKEIMSDCVPSLYTITMQEHYEELDITLHDTIFVKYLEELLEFRGITGANIIISDYRSNLDPAKYEEKQKVPKKEFVILYAQDNEFYTVTLYHYDESYYLDENEGETKDES